LASDTVVLAFDTSGPFCAAAVLKNGEFTACRADEMARGQAEAIMDMIGDVLQTSGVILQDVTRIGVGTGPGNFTGIRISVSAARGFALSLGIPAIGVNGFDATLHGQSEHAIACLPAIRDQIYFAGRDLGPEMGEREQVAQLGRPLINLSCPRATGPKYCANCAKCRSVRTTCSNVCKASRCSTRARITPKGAR
jgi:tRNA threonylcarbamoyl adenosine modification protein YeaZ